MPLSYCNFIWDSKIRDTQNVKEEGKKNILSSNAVDTMRNKAGRISNKLTRMIEETNFSLRVFEF